MPSNTNSDAGAIYVQWSDDGQHIRKWSRGPFEGAVMFHQSETGAALTREGRGALERTRDALRDLQPALNVMAREIIDDIITDHIAPALKGAV